MSDALTVIVAVLAALVVGGAVGVFGRQILSGRKVAAAQTHAEQIVEAAEDQKKTLVLEAKEEALRFRSQAENEIGERRTEVQRIERRLQGREENLDNRAENLERKERGLGEKEQQLEDRIKEAEEARAREVQRLEAISGLTAAEARDVLLTRAEGEIKHDLARRFRDIEQEFKDQANQKARRAITLAIHRLAADVVSESSTKVIPLPSDDMKGRLIGREGRNIRALEQATGVDLIIDDTPEAVTISCFDPIRREIARVALKNLIEDGRIHPARIEDMVERARKEVDEDIWSSGEKAVLDAGVRGLNPELIKLLGRLKFRYSYGENMLYHAVEVALICGMLAAEVGANIEVAKAGGLLHDIGKALTHEVDGPHAEIGRDVAERFGIPDAVRRSIEEHHDEEMGSVEAFIVAAGDAIVAARPGARRDTVEMYTKRLQALEEVANSFPGVEKTFAIQAGREVRIMVSPEQVDDAQASKMAYDIVKKIEEKLVYPGQIKVMVIRETRNVEFAR
jgi:ribonuclease Y